MTYDVQGHELKRLGNQWGYWGEDEYGEPTFIPSTVAATPNTTSTVKVVKPTIASKATAPTSWSELMTAANLPDFNRTENEGQGPIVRDIPGFGKVTFTPQYFGSQPWTATFKDTNGGERNLAMNTQPEAGINDPDALSEYTPTKMSLGKSLWKNLGEPALPLVAAFIAPQLIGLISNGAALASTAFAPEAATAAGITEAGISSGALSYAAPEAVAGWASEAVGGGTFAGAVEADLAMQLAPGVTQAFTGAGSNVLAGAAAAGTGLTLPSVATGASTGGGFSSSLIPTATGMPGAAGTGLGITGGGGVGTGLQLPLALGGTAAGLGLSSGAAGAGFDAGISAVNPNLGQLLNPVAEGLTSAGVKAGVTSAIGAPAGSYTGTVPGTVGEASTLTPELSPQDAFSKILNGTGTAADYAKLGIPLASALGGAALGATASKPADYNITGTTESDTTSNSQTKLDSTSTQSTSFSPEETAARAKILADAEKNYNALQGTQYPGQQVTPFSADTLAAQDKLRSFSSGAGQTAADQAAAALKFGLGDVLYPGTNPGLQAMIDTTTRKVGETYTDPNGVLSKIRGGFTAGSSGGSGTREGVANGLAARSYLNTIGDVTGKLTSDAYNQGLNTFSNTLNSVPATMAAMQVPGKTLAEVGGQVEAKSAEQQAYEANKRMWGITSPTAFLGDFNKILASISNPTKTTTSSGTTNTTGTSHTSGTNNSTISGGQENPFAPLGGALQGLTLGSQLYKILYPNG